MNLTFLKSNSSNMDFKALVVKLDADLAIRDGDEHGFYNQYNGIDHLDIVLLAYDGDAAVGCGAIKRYATNTAEVKRMYVLKNYRGQRIATKLLEQLELMSLGLGYTKLILETGVRNPEAITLYKRCGYCISDNYDQYVGMESSICFAKRIP